MKASPIRRTRRKSSGPSRSFFQQPATQPAFFTGTDATVHRKCEECANEDKSVQRAEAAGASAPARAPTGGAVRYIHSLPRGGEPMPTGVRGFFESRMQTDLGAVRIHHDAEAAQSASALHAQAYTVGEDIVFNRDKYAPDTESGRELLAHELVHVMQQRGGAPGGKRVQMMPEDTAAPGDQEPDQKPKAGAAAVPEEEGQAAPGDAKAAQEQEKAAKAGGEKLSEPVPIANFATFGKPTTHTDFAKFVKFDGKTDAVFDGGVGQTQNLKGVPAKDCSGCSGDECVHVTGTLQVTYSVSTTVTLPDMPAGLTPCQEKIVGDAINNKIAPHEGQHVSAFNTYNGTVNLPINYTGCKSGLEKAVQAIHDTHAAAREAAARAKSAALDPFVVSVNLDCVDAPPPKKP
ncbi:MAG TPA: DUF4157 domain-containing protein [Verrucomicrobiae bacterium]|nr:DUF4157 domain-containing protein [Verrucomicrobiae bacterium]